MPQKLTVLFVPTARRAVTMAAEVPLNAVLPALIPLQQSRLTVLILILHVKMMTEQRIFRPDGHAMQDTTNMATTFAIKTAMSQTAPVLL